MLFSIITVAFNAEKTISRTLKSVNEQSYRDFEHIIIDGASSDNTLTLLDEYKSDRQIVISEPDNGIYDAMNKGVSVAKGTYILFLNSDDQLKSPQTLESLAALSLDQCDVICGGIEILGEDGRVFGHWPSDLCLYFSGRLFLQAPHPGFLVKRQVLQKTENHFDLSYRLAADLDQMLKLFNRGFRFKFSSEVVTSMYLGGASTVSFSARLQGLRESLIIYWQYFSIFSPILLLLRIFSKLTKYKW